MHQPRVEAITVNRLCHADEAQQGRNRCPWLPDIYPGYTVLRMRAVMATPWSFFDTIRCMLNFGNRLEVSP